MIRFRMVLSGVVTGSLFLAGCASLPHPHTVVVEDDFGRVQSRQTVELARPGQAARTLREDYATAVAGDADAFDEVLRSAAIFLRVYPDARQGALVRDLGMLAALRMAVKTGELTDLRRYEQDFVSAGYVRHALAFLNADGNVDGWRAQLSSTLAAGLWLRDGMHALVAALGEAGRITRIGLRVDEGIFLSEMRSARAELETIDKWYEDYDIEGLARAFGGEER